MVATIRFVRLLPLLCLAVSSALGLRPAHAQSPYTAFVAAGADSIVVVDFDGTTARVVRAFEVGALPDSVEGVHSLAVSPDGKFVFATVGNGRPDGRLVRIHAESGRSSGVAELGPGVSSLLLSGDGTLAYLTMSNPSVSMSKGSVWVVGTADLKPVASLTTCILPAGGRMTPAQHHYSVCGMEDQVIELDMAGRRVNRRFSVAEEAEEAVDTTAAPPDGPFTEGRVLPPSCSPTAAEPSVDGRSVWVACNRNATVVEINAKDWTLGRKLEAGHGPYLLALTPDGKTLAVVLRQGHALQLFDAAKYSLRARVELAVAPNSVEISRDGRYAFVTTEGAAGGAGTLDIVDIIRAQRVASLALAPKAGALVLWRQPR